MNIYVSNRVPSLWINKIFLQWETKYIDVWQKNPYKNEKYSHKRVNKIGMHCVNEISDIFV